MDAPFQLLNTYLDEQINVNTIIATVLSQTLAIFI